LRAVLPVERRDHLERLARGVAVEGPAPTPPGAERARGAFLAPVQQAVAARRVLRVVYRAKGQAEDSRRDVEALGVVFYGEAWYLVAWCRLRDGLRHFRVDRIQNIDTLAETFVPRRDFSLEDHLAERTEGGQTFPARVWVGDEALERAQRESYATLEFGARRDGGVECVLFTWCYDWLARWLLSFGERAEALEPAELRTKVREQAERVLARYAAEA
ncbi:MAG: WYL domain-containing protein, partial [Verrucomicrobiota bacterium]